MGVTGKIAKNFEESFSYGPFEEYGTANKKLYYDYTANQAIAKVEFRTGIQIGRNNLHKILRNEGIIDEYKNVAKKYNHLFCSRVSPVTENSYSVISESYKLFITEEGIDFIISNLDTWNCKYKKWIKNNKRHYAYRKFSI